ncbi:hypothetical protein MTR_8g042355 [Medicago truncatula]|uniref:Uncharacterized protein n=1 Tax=Medicago truncatula TaxID=3880 RepID=A0A072TQP9_MEDTR|nr:hypothetical protein MTR_8g042355 [Medicago truncatula]
MLCICFKFKGKMNQEVNNIQSPSARTVASGGVNEQGEHSVFTIMAMADLENSLLTFESLVLPQLLLSLPLLSIDVQICFESQSIKMQFTLDDVSYLCISDDCSEQVIVSRGATIVGYPFGIKYESSSMKVAQFSTQDSIHENCMENLKDWLCNLADMRVGMV